MSLTTGRKTKSELHDVSSGAVLLGVGLRVEFMGLFVSIIAHPLNWSIAYGRLPYAFSLTLGPITISQIDYTAYYKYMKEQQSEAAKAMMDILSKIEETSETAKSKLKDITKTEESSDGK